MAWCISSAAETWGSLICIIKISKDQYIKGSRDLLRFVLIHPCCKTLLVTWRAWSFGPIISAVPIFYCLAMRLLKGAHKGDHPLTVNGIWGVVPPCCKISLVKNIGKLFANDFLPMSLKFYWLTFKNNFKALVFLGSCHVTSSWQEVNENLQFSRFLKHI